jgi:hypothetical protein
MDRKTGPLNRCPDARALLPAYVENELDTAETGRVAGHLQICASCRREEAAFRHALTALGAAPRRDAPGDLFYGFQAKLEGRNRRSNRRFRQLRLAGSAAALLLIVGFATAQVTRMIRRETPPVSVNGGEPKIAEVRPDANAINPAPAPDTNVAGPKKLTAVPPIDDPKDQTEPNKAKLQPVTPTQTDKPKRAKNGKQEPVDFWDVKPKSGKSLRDRYRQREQMRMANDPGQRHLKVVPHERPLPEIPAHKLGAEMIPDRNERVQVGRQVTTIQTAYHENEEGRRTAIEINIGTRSVQSP